MSKRFTAQIFRWLNQVNADGELPATALKVCVELTGCFREAKKGMAWPGLQSIADTIGKSKATVLTAIRILEQRGHLKVQYGRPGAGHSNRYWLIEKGQPANLSARPKKVRKKGQPANLNLLKETPRGGLKTPSLGDGEREREARCREQVSPDPGGAPVKGAPGCFEGGTEPAESLSSTAPPEPAAPPKEGARGKEAGQEPAERLSTLRHNENEGDAPAVWREILACYRRGWASDDDPKQIAIARTAFAKLIGQGTAASEIVAGVKRWVTGVDAPRYLPPLFELLSTGAWQSEPPAKRKRRSAAAATGVALAGRALPRTNGNKVDLSLMGLQRAGYVQDENGNVYHPEGNAGSAYFWLQGARGGAAS
jgi:hypothetical protein